MRHGSNMNFWGFESRQTLTGERFGLLETAAKPPAGGGAGGGNTGAIMGGVAAILGMYMMTDASKHNATAAKDATIASANALADARRTEAQLRADAIMHDSDNKLAMSQDANQTMRFAIMTGSRDFNFQMLSWLTGQLEALDTKEQIAFRDADVRLAQIKSDEKVAGGQQKVAMREVDVRAIEARQPQLVETNGLV